MKERGPKMAKIEKNWCFFNELLIYANILQLKTLKSIDLFIDSRRA